MARVRREAWRWAVCLVLTAAGAVRAEERVLVMAAGDCSDSSLQTQAAQLAGALAQGPGARVVSDEEVRARLDRPSARTPDELQRQIDAAQMLFLDAEFARAETQVNEALAEVDRLPPGEERTRLRLLGLTVQIMVLRGTGRNDRSDDAMRSILRVAPQHKLDPLWLSPIARTRFEQLRSEPKKALLAVTSQPPGADLLIDGVKLGVTPFEGRLTPGAVRVEVARHGQRSLGRWLMLKTSGASAHIDLDLEGSLDPARRACLLGSTDEGVRLSRAVKLGVLFGVEQVVLLRLERPTPGSEALTAELIEVKQGQRARQGTLKMGPHAPVAQLADFLRTGVAGPDVKQGAERHVETPPIAPARSVPAPVAQVEPPERSAPVAQVLREDRVAWERYAGIGLMAAGGASILVGGLYAGGSYASAQRAGAYYRDGRLPTVNELATVARHQRRADAQRKTAMTLGLAGAAAAIAGGVVLWAEPEAAPISGSVGPTGAQLSGSFQWP
jgi:hypothetical protein